VSPQAAPASSVAEHIAEVVAKAPPLTPEQADQLRALLPAPGQ
jgi:hypothetical protein